MPGKGYIFLSTQQLDCLESLDACRVEKFGINDINIKIVPEQAPYPAHNDMQSLLPGVDNFIAVLRWLKTIEPFKVVFTDKAVGLAHCCHSLMLVATPGQGKHFPYLVHLPVIF